MDIAGHLRPGDRVLIGQATAEPPALVEQFISAAATIDGLTAVCGYTLSDAWRQASPGRPRIESYILHGPLRELGEKGMVDVVACHYTRLAEVMTRDVDVVLLQVGPPDENGCFDLGATADYALLAAERARTVLVEVNSAVPRTRSSRRLHASRVTAAISSDRSLAGSPDRPPTEAERRVAANVAALVPSGATIQLGAGALGAAVAAELRGRTGLRVRSGLAGDWLVDLYEAGALDLAPGSCVVGIALGTERLYRFVEESPLVRIAPIEEQLAPAAIARAKPFVAVNGAIEVDLLGQVNSEVVAGRYVGAVGGQVDFFRACRLSEGGRAIVALPSTSGSGASRIVRRLSGPVTSLKSDIDFVVTEHGAADIGAAPLGERAAKLAAIAAPEHRAELLRSGPVRWCR